MTIFLSLMLCLTATFLILLILIQRGRGGGLAGAFGGMGGQSAFGTKAGDVFTRVTIVTAAFWILLCAVSVKVFSSAENRLSGDLGGDAVRNESTDPDKAGSGATGPRKSSSPAPDKGAAGKGGGAAKGGTETSSEKGTAAPATSGAAPATSGAAPATSGAAAGKSAEAPNEPAGKTSTEQTPVEK